MAWYVFGSKIMQQICKYFNNINKFNNIYFLKHHLIQTLHLGPGLEYLFIKADMNLCLKSSIQISRKCPVTYV